MLRVNHTVVRINLKSVNGAQHVTRKERTVEGRRIQGDKVLSRLAEILVNALGCQLVVTGHRGSKRFRVHTELLSELLDGVGLLDAPQFRGCCHLPSKRLETEAFKLRIVRRGVNARATHGVEYLDLLNIISVPNGAELVSLLHAHLMKGPVIRARLIAEPLTTRVDLKERLVADPARRTLIGIARLGAHRQCGALERHKGRVHIFDAARPNTSADAIAHASRLRHRHAAHKRARRVQKLKQVGVGLITAARQDDTLGSIDLDIAFVIGALGNCSRNATGPILN